jgi:hypothetical protein
MVPRTRTVRDARSQQPSTCTAPLQEESAQLWRNLDWAKSTAPTHPHPEGPAGGLAARLVHPVVGAMDKVAAAAAA